MSPVSDHTISSSAVTARSERHLPVLSTGLGLGGIDVVGAEGVWFHLADGRSVIDASNTAAPLGHRYPSLVAAAQKAADSPALNEGWAWPGRQQAADDLLATVFGEEQDWVGAVRFFNSASEANDQALSLAQALTGRSALATRERAYHGMVGLSREMTVQPQWHGGLSSLHGGWRPAPRLADVRQLPAPRCGVYSPCTQEGGCECLPAGVSGQLRDVAAVIIDYSQGGIYPSPVYQDAIARAAREAGALWIADEVVTGLGRQGRWLTLQRGTERPDIVTLGKGLAGGAAPAAAVVLSAGVTGQLADQLWQSYSTFRGHPLSVAAISATVTGIAEQGLVSHADSFDATLRPWMTAIGDRHPSVERVDGLGLHWTVELRGAQRWREWHGDTSERTIADSVVAAALEADVLIATSAEEASLFIAPPLVVSAAELEKILGALERGLSVADRILGSLGG
jgi:4-aminobutyrate aminotransferase-like enzyme